MTTLSIAAEFGKIWAKFVAVVAVGASSFYGIAWLLFTSQVVTSDKLNSVNDMFFMLVLPVSLLFWAVLMIIQITWNEAKWRLEKKERGW